MMDKQKGSNADKGGGMSITNNKAKCERQKEIFSSRNYKPYYIYEPKPRYSGGFCDETSHVVHVTYSDGQKFFRKIAEAGNEEAALIVKALNQLLATEAMPRNGE